MLLDSSLYFYSAVFSFGNDTPTGFFSSYRSLRQEDPLSPLLFVIVMVLFNRMIFAPINGGLLSWFLVGTWIDISIFCLWITLIFSRVALDHQRHLWCLLLCFEAVSSLKVNLVLFLLSHTLPFLFPLSLSLS